MHPEASRVVYNNQPYLVLTGEDGSAEHAYGPFPPGTEPSLSECTPDKEVHDGALLATLQGLVPISPALPAHEDTLAGS
jgi:hypothetical protein